MTGYYALQFEINPGDWFTLSYWEMEESLLPDFLLHILDLHHSIECRDELRVRRIDYSELLEVRAYDPERAAIEEIIRRFDADIAKLKGVRKTWKAKL